MEEPLLCMQFPDSIHDASSQGVGSRYVRPWRPTASQRSVAAQSLEKKMPCPFNSGYDSPDGSYLGAMNGSAFQHISPLSVGHQRRPAVFSLCLCVYV